MLTLKFSYFAETTLYTKQQQRLLQLLYQLHVSSPLNHQHHDAHQVRRDVGVHSVVVVHNMTTMMNMTNMRQIEREKETEMIITMTLDIQQQRPPEVKEEEEERGPGRTENLNMMNMRSMKMRDLTEEVKI